MPPGLPLPRVVLLGNGAKGAEGQCEGLIRALGFGGEYQLVDPWCLGYWLRLLPASAHVLLNSLGVLDGPTAEAAGLAAGTPGHPTLVVASGRDTVPAGVRARQQAPTHTAVVQIQLPRVNPALYDLVLCPEHDAAAAAPWKGALGGPGGPQVAFTKGALHRIDAEALRHGREALAGELTGLPRPLLAICAGGPTRRCRYDPARLGAELGGIARRALQEGAAGSVRATISRRTPPEMAAALEPWLWDEQAYGDTAYPGLLAYADGVVVTADSVSMLSEAASLGKPLYVAGRHHCTGKIRAFVGALLDTGVAKEAGAGLPGVVTGWRPPDPLRATEEAAARVGEVCCARGWQLPGGVGDQTRDPPRTA